jgi:hypothetical protein
MPLVDVLRGVMDSAELFLPVMELLLAQCCCRRA